LKSLASERSINLIQFKASQLELVNLETEIMPGIRGLATPGHTPGQMALAITSKDVQLLCVSDVVLHSIDPEKPE
jgi:glyoxylase-like metal-dependent hydrolase (beta-lactamase superfamily II)